MKKILKYLIAAFLLGFLLLPCSCDKTQEPIEPDPTDTTAVDTTSVDTSTVSNHIIPLGQSYVLRNNTVWLGQLEASYYRSINNRTHFILRGGITYSNLRREYIAILDIPSDTRIYKPEPWPLWGPDTLFSNSIPNPVFTVTQDLDQPVGDYQIDSNRNDHFIEILHIDTVENIVEGRLQLFMSKYFIAPGWNPAPPEYISLTEGKFHLKIKEL